MRRPRRTVMVTGSSMGVGLTIAAEFAAQGDSVVICARNPGPLKEAAAAIERFPGQILSVVCDVSREEDVNRLVSRAIEIFGRIDVLVNNAGIYGPIGLAHESDSRAWLEALCVNLFGVFLSVKLVVPHMIRQGQGKIINVTGGGAATPIPRYSAYACSKTALVRFTEILALELAEFKIQVNSITPGFVKTRLHEETLRARDRAGEFFHKTTEQLASGGADPRLAADLVTFLASHEADKITGRYISAVWDDWRGLEEATAFGGGASLYTLRRIDNVHFREVAAR